MLYFAADLHLIRYIWREKRELDGDGYAALQEMVRKILADNTSKKALVLAGDIFEQNRLDGTTLEVFTEALDRLTDGGVQVLFIQGNHDRNASPHALVQGAEWLAEKLCIVDGHKLYGMDWCPREELHEKLAKVPACDILVLHAQFEHLINYGGAADISLDDIPAQVKSVVVGDIHIPDLTEFRGTGWCLSPGPLHACNIAQGGPKYFWKLPAGAAKPEPVELTSRAIHRISLAADSPTEPILQSVVGAVGALRPIVEVSYDNRLQLEVEQLMVKYREQAVFFPRAYQGGRFLERLEDDPATAVAPVEMPQVIDRTTDEGELRSFLQDLWKSGNAAEVISHKINKCYEVENAAEAVNAE
jgi:hypothetical protein